jgi:hypothetical protein
VEEIKEKFMFADLDSIVLAHDIKEHGLKEGDVGTVVHVYAGKKAYEVEFVTTKGNTVAVLSLTSSDIRAMNKEEILHVRGVASV